VKLVSWNVNGIRSVAKKDFYDSALSLQADILCLQEVRASQAQIPPEALLPQYELFWNEAKCKKGYSGVAVFTKIKPIAVHYGFDEEDFDAEGRVLLLEFANWVLYCIYFPNGGASEERLDFKLRFYDTFLEHSNQWIKKGYQVVTCGDFNTCHKEIDIARPKENVKNSGFLPVERAWMDKYFDSGYVDTFRVQHPQAQSAYTWWSNRGGARERNIGWRLDYFTVNQEWAPEIKNASIHADILGSDHCPVSLEITPKQ
jgi:exodeoxyribonuclease III